jgi:hypothetical protein
MSKRKRRNERSRRQAPKVTPVPDDIDVVEGSGFRMERHGRFIHMTTNRTEAEQQALMEKMAASAENLSADLEKRAKAIESQIQEYDTFTILGALTLQNHVKNPDTYKEYSYPGKSFVSEYATLLALSHPYSEGTKEFIAPPVLHEIQKEIEHVFSAASWHEMAKYARRKIAAGEVSEAPTALEEMQFRMRTHELIVRNPAYEHHHHEVLRGLFRAVEKDLLALVGFSIDDALAISRAISVRMDRVFSERLQKAREGMKDMKNTVHKAKHSGVSTVNKAGNNEMLPPTLEYYRELSKRSPKEVDNFLKSATLAWLFFGAAEICSFTVDELVDEITVPPERVKAFVSLLSMTFGDVPTDDIMPSPTHPLRARPLVRHEEFYLSSAPMLLDWAIQPAFETALKTSGGSRWQRYQKQRHDHVLNLSVEILQRMMPGATIENNLLYCCNGDLSRETEIDAIAIYDGIVFLIEVKGADITAPARRGAPDRLRRDLEEVIAKSHSQALRAKDYISSSRESVFRRADGGPDFIIPTGVRDVIMISVSLAPLGHLTALLHADSDIGFFRDGEYSWVVSIYDLIVIGDMVDLPPMFPHYVMRRVYTAHQGILEAHDELDLFGYYLNEGLYIDDIAGELQTKAGKAWMGLLSYTGQFDDYYSYITGSRQKRTEKPAQRMQPKLREMLVRLEKSGLSGRVDVAMAILDLCHETRLSFLSGIEKVQKISLREHRISDATVCGEEGKGWGLTYMCDREPSKLEASLRLHCNRKQQQLKYKKWVGVAEVIDSNPRIASIYVLEA